MSIAQQRLLTLAGDIEHKREIVDGLQSLGALHLVPLAEYPGDLGPDEAADARAALNYLKGSPRQRRPQRPTSDQDLATIVRKVLRNKYRREDAIDRAELIRQHQRALRPWGDFELPDRDELGGHRLWFYRVSQGKEEGLGQIELPWQIVNSDERYHYLVVINPDEPSPDEVPYRRMHTGSLSLSQLEQDYEATLVELENLEAKRESLTRWSLTLQDSLNRILDTRDLVQAERETLDSQDIFVLQAWIPEHAVPRLAEWVETVPAGYTLREPDEHDTPPTLLENSDRLGGGQEAVSFFQLPGYSNWDPSNLIFVSFSLFFAMILADAGYAALLGVVLLFNWRRMSEPGSTAVRLRNLWASLVVCTVVYGALTGSYFGVSPPPDSLLGALVLLDLNDFDTMMRLSVAIGTLHLMIAHAAVFWINRGRRVGMVALAWLIGTGSGFGLWMHFILAPDFSLASSPFSFGLVAWLVLLMLFSGERPYDSVRHVALNLVSGLGALTGLTKAFGDVLSYMRLFALGLAGASLAATFNELAVSAREALPHAGFLAFLLILLLGHTLNIVLSLMSGVIHGLRLNLMEFYNWGIHDEGFPFKAFAKRGGGKWKNS
ncbi:MAG: hypothetical protein QNI86_06825 [Halieaceae bacterium]|nr:hypothetical protein [Halieaceae bacterium]